MIVKVWPQKSSSLSFPKTSIASLYCFRTVVSQGVPLSCGISIGSDRLPYLLTVRLSEREICQPNHKCKGNQNPDHWTTSSLSYARRFDHRLLLDREAFSQENQPLSCLFPSTLGLKYPGALVWEGTPIEGSTPYFYRDGTLPRNVSLPCAEVEGEMGNP